MTRTQLWEVSSLIRSKNAGPFVLTFDIMFDRSDDYLRVKEAEILSPTLVSALYDVPINDIRFFYCDNALAIKFSIPRPHISGDLEDGDVYGGQQYAPIVSLELPDGLSN